MTAARITSYLDERTLPFPFCPGCGHGTILTRLDEALVRLQLDPRQVVVVSDIGCQGLSDRFFATNAFHGLHGRSVTYATGIKLANPDLHVIVLIGDGGCGIGGHHLVNAARRNIGISVLVFNNFNFGMTGGEHSVTTPPDAVTATTRYGNLEQPLDICATVGANGATFVARSTVFEPDLTNLIEQAIRHDGFGLIDIWELCTAYFAPYNEFKKSAIKTTLDQLDFATGILHRQDRVEFSRAYREATRDQRGRPVLAPQPLEVRYAAQLSARTNCVIAGTAGQKIGSAAAVFCRGAILSGLWASQHNDYPVTVRSGHSVADVILAPEPILHTGPATPDIMLVLFSEGLRKEQHRIAHLGPEATVFVNADLLPIQTAARTVALDFGATRQKRLRWALMGLAEILRQTNLYALEALRCAAALSPAFAEQNLAAIDAIDRLEVHQVR
jgi:2-oxoglutarate ferredoxin oxidoreductase subunit beta